MDQLTRNRARCDECGTVLESRHRHDFRTCPCPAKFSVDGGLAYTKRNFAGRWTELSEYADVLGSGKPTNMRSIDG